VGRIVTGSVGNIPPGLPHFFGSTKCDNNSQALVDLFRGGSALSAASISLWRGFASAREALAPVDDGPAAPPIPSGCFTADGDYSMEARNAAGGS
jgi:hypothetical protein